MAEGERPRIVGVDLDQLVLGLRHHFLGDDQDVTVRGLGIAQKTGRGGAGLGWLELMVVFLVYPTTVETLKLALVGVVPVTRNAAGGGPLAVVVGLDEDPGQHRHRRTGRQARNSHRCFRS